MTPTLGIPEEPLSGEDHCGPKQKPEHTNLDKGADQQGLHPKDLDEQIQDPQEEPLRGELSDGPIPELMKVSRTTTAGHAEQEQPIVGGYEYMLEMAGHEILVEGVAGRENGSNRDSSIAIASTESEEEIKNLKKALQELKTMDISKESKLSLQNVKRLIQRNFNENPLEWWDRNKIKATLKIKEECKYEYVRYKPIQMDMEDKKDVQMIIKEHINLELIEPGISAYSSLGFLVRNHGEIKRGIELQEHIVEKIRNFPDVLKDKKHLQRFLGVVNFAGIFIKDLTKYRKDFRPFLKETESAKWKWEEIHTQRVCELKQVCNNLPKLAIPQDEDELVVYTDVLMKKTTTGEEPEIHWRISSQEMEASEANSIMLRFRHLRENLEELDKKFGRLAVNAQVARQIQRADLDTVQIAIRTTIVASTSL
ncbi:UNVERIFIED_CONTAM: Enzymatic polyprotein [Sesamum calycinum]|uniref:Enzymatic polyprotein n=1 Tax=Sesamum calycinum TaxID=2727403 RepID=A0AAW2QKM9_9LAMI